MGMHCRNTVKKTKSIILTPANNTFFVQELSLVEARVTIRFMRIGRKHAAFYRLIAVDSRKKRDTKPLEFLGWYNPKTKETKLNTPSLRKWLKVGAQPSNTITNLLRRAMIIRVAQ